MEGLNEKHGSAVGEENTRWYSRCGAQQSGVGRKEADSRVFTTRNWRDSGADHQWGLVRSRFRWLGKLPFQMSKHKASLRSVL